MSSTMVSSRPGSDASTSGVVHAPTRRSAVAASSTCRIRAAVSAGFPTCKHDDRATPMMKWPFSTRRVATSFTLAASPPKAM